MKKYYILLTIIFVSFIYLSCSSCEPLMAPSNEEIWKLHKSWHFPPPAIRSKEVFCKKDEKEYFYYKSSATLSYVALVTLKKQNKPNIKASCMNNALLQGKSRMFRAMLHSAVQEYIQTKKRKPSSGYEEEILKNLAEHNRKKENAGIYDCKSLATQHGSEEFLACDCILYASFPDGKKGIIDEL
ncbi:MAG: hypothetical protein H7A25_20950 [Leptospiraceae bacterium]|nr:hypothetical protein [Leptospiraceae bacterium]MCP5502378.1 hypothetical protein [Leptospiraceae bacterium]